MFYRIFILLILTLCIGCSDAANTKVAVERVDRLEKLLSSITKRDMQESKKHLDFMRKVDSSNEYLFEIEQTMQNNAAIVGLQPLLNQGEYEKALLLIQESFQNNKRTDRLDKIESQIKQFLAMKLLSNELKAAEEVDLINLMIQRAVRIGKKEEQLEDVANMFKIAAEDKIALIKHKKRVDILCDIQMDRFYAYDQLADAGELELLFWKNLAQKHDLITSACDKIYDNTDHSPINQ